MNRAASDEGNTVLGCYCQEQDLAFKVPLLFDNVPAHPKHFDSIHPNIIVRFLPPNTTLPFDQGVMHIQGIFFTATISQMLQATDDFENPRSLPTVKEWWKSEHLAQMAVDTDPSSERSQHFCRSLPSALLPYKQIYAEKQNAPKQTTLITFFKPVSSPAAGSSKNSVSLPSPLAVLDDPDDPQHPPYPCKATRHHNNHSPPGANTPATVVVESVEY
ncbi:uncharacterized protein LOC132404113 [Hypanus sabinus]|uniref:uncharacterized protein LOC132404113 n=1 Tax=Hypanus sabinus TaxID=79690 RepID=UPI0028C48CF0|nr:uncharacterized protein LOC132404113 [Hypanus sabinus]